MSKSKHDKQLLARARKAVGPPTARLKPTDMTADDIRALVREGHSKAQIARFYGVNRTTVWRVLNPEKNAQCRAREDPPKRKPKAVDDDFLSGPLSWFGM